MSQTAAGPKCPCSFFHLFLLPPSHLNIGCFFLLISLSALPAVIRLFVHSFILSSRTQHAHTERDGEQQRACERHHSHRKRGPAQNIYGLDREARFSASRTILRWIRRWLSPVWRGIFCTPCTAIQPHGTIAKQKHECPI